MFNTVRKLDIAQEAWPIAGSFTIARGSKSIAEVVVAQISQGSVTGRGECVPYARNNETVERVVSLINSVRRHIETGCTSQELQALLPPGAARNALDCALVDLEAKLFGVPARMLFGLDAASPAITAFTISLGTPQEMAAAAKLNHIARCLK